MFTLLHLDSAATVDRARFVDGRRAARAARLLSVKTGSRYQPRPLPADAAAVDWQARERARLESGEYIPPHPDLAAIAPTEHYAHCAKKSHDLIAYTRDAAKGAADRQSLISIEAYVTLVAPAEWSCADKLRAVEAQRAHALAMCSPVRFARTPDEIEAVYTNYAHDTYALGASCMRHPARRFDARVDGEPFHPARVYGAGDLAIAYLANADGETVARALVWPEKKLYSRLYCGEDSTLPTALRALGYEGAGYYGGARTLRGARLLRVESDNDALVAPYLDEIGTVDDCGDYLRIGGDIGAQNVTGLADDGGAYCENCEDFFNARDLVPVFTDGGRRNSALWCEHCRDSHTFYCDGYGAEFSDSVDYDEMNGCVYSLAWLEDNAYRCEHTDEWCDSTTEVIIDESGNTEFWGDSAVSSDAYEYNGVYYSDDIDYITVTTRRAEMVSIKWLALCYLKDTRVRIPAYLVAEAGAPIAFEASDGRYYAPDYIDCYPAARPRLVPAEDGQAVLPYVAA